MSMIEKAVYRLNVSILAACLKLIYYALSEHANLYCNFKADSYML